MKPPVSLSLYVLKSALYGVGWTLGLGLRLAIGFGGWLYRTARAARHAGDVISCPHHGCEQAADAWFECGTCRARSPDLWVWGPCPVCGVEPGYTVCRCGAAIRNPHLRN